MYRVLMMWTLSITAAACGQGPSAPSPAAKALGPNTRSLNHEKLMAIAQECHAFGQIDDPRVKYSMEYCASVDSAHASEGWAAPSTATVDPKLNKLH
jgi:hypothetical protein